MLPWTSLSAGEGGAPDAARGAPPDDSTFLSWFMLALLPPRWGWLYTRFECFELRVRDGTADTTPQEVARVPSSYGPEEES